jgi:hypothetical protein
MFCSFAAIKRKLDVFGPHATPWGRWRAIIAMAANGLS